MPTQDERFDRVDAAIERLSQRFDRMDARFDATDARFDATDARFDAMDTRFDAMDTRFDAMDTRFDAMDTRFDATDARIDTLNQHTDARFDGVDARFDGVAKYILDFREEVSDRLRAIESRADLQFVTLTSIESRESRVPALTKAVAEAGSFSGKLAMELSKHRDAAFIFESRLLKLEETVAKLLKPAA